MPSRNLARSGAFAATIAIVLAISSVVGAEPVLAETALNPRNFALKLERLDPKNDDTNFMISACPQTKCFDLSGAVKIVSAPQSETVDYEGFFPIAGSACALHFEQMSYGGMVSGDYRLTLVSNGQGAKNCGALPAGLAGVYKQVVMQSRAEGARFQMFTGPTFETLAKRTDAACPDAHVRFFNAGDLAWEEETFEGTLAVRDRAKITAAIERTADGASRTCENSNGLSCSASTDLEAIEKAGQLGRFATFVCATKPPR